MLEKIFDNWKDGTVCNLRHIDLREYSVDPDEGMQITGALTCSNINKLHTLKISYNHCANNNQGWFSNDVNVEQLCEIIIKQTELRELELVYNGFNEQQTGMIAEAILASGSLSSLTDVNLACAAWDTDNIRNIAKIIAKAPMLTLLGIGGCRQFRVVLVKPSDDAKPVVKVSQGHDEIHTEVCEHANLNITIESCPPCIVDLECSVIEDPEFD